MSDHGSDYDPQRSHRWILRNSGCDSLRVKSIQCHWNDLWGLTLDVEFMALVTTDLSEPPLRGESATLLLLDRDGNAREEYDVSWSGSRFTPFDRLTYSPDEDDTVIQTMRLSGVHFKNSKGSRPRE